VRLNFEIGFNDHEYFIDRNFDENKTDQKNCDDVLDYVINFINDGKAIAVMRLLKDDKEKAQPVILNTKNLVEISVLNLAVYTTEDKEEDDTK
jgi:hypothetical protein